MHNFRFLYKIKRKETIISREYRLSQFNIKERKKIKQNFKQITYSHQF